MSTLLAPYQNAMRLGQGFNSYTQQICVDNAVKVTDRKTGNTITDLAETGTVKNRSNSQIVTYNSRHVDKLSDVSDSMNISGSLAIKYGTIQGSGSGAFVDTNKFRESDMNFLLQVKVINQTQILEESYEYQKLANVSKEKFTEVFGDCFISGFLEGGEFNALISIKVLDKSKLRDIKAAASLALSVGGVGIEASGSVGIKSSEIAQHTETTVSVSWSGGGVLKRPEEVWNISTVTAAASKFADLVAQTPQRTSAILTRYTSLRSFVIDQKDLSPLNYDNAGVYTADLLDAYMDYKLHWKNINIMLDESALYIKNPEPVYLPADLTTDEKTDVTLYEPNAFSLTRARTFCRQQMIRIVTEVDVVAKDPTTACKDSKAPYQSPDIFRARLPVLRKIEPTTVPAAAVEEGKSLQNRRRSAFAALRLDGYKQTHLYYVDTAGNIRYSVCNIEAGTQAGVWKDGGIVEEAKNVAANTPIAAAATFGSGKKPRVIFFNTLWQLRERTMDDKGVWTDGMAIPAKLKFEPAPYSQLGYATSTARGGLGWVFYQGKDNRIVECWYDVANMAFHDDGAGRDKYLPAAPGTAIGAATAIHCSINYQLDNGQHTQFWWNPIDNLWNIGGYNLSKLVFPPGSHTSVAITNIVTPPSVAEIYRHVMRAYVLDGGWRVNETIIRTRDGPMTWGFSPFVPVVQATAGSQTAVVAWNDDAQGNGCVRLYVHDGNGLVQEWIRTGESRFEPGAVPVLL